MISLCVAAYNRDEMLARTLPTWREATRELREPAELIVVTGGTGSKATYALVHDQWSADLEKCGCIRVPSEQPFSAGAWRTLAADAAKGRILVMLDADMEVPPDYMATLARVVRTGAAAFPLYMRERSPGGPQSPGIGWGNSAISRDMWERACQATDGRPYPTGTTWGGEDVAFARTITQTLRIPVWRRLVPGLVHLWHSKRGTPWYDGATTPLADGTATE